MPRKATLPNNLQKYWNELPNGNKNTRVTFKNNNSKIVVNRLYNGLPKENYFQTHAEEDKAIVEARNVTDNVSPYTHMNRRITPNEAARLGNQLAKEEHPISNSFMKPLGTTNNWLGGTRKRHTRKVRKRASLRILKRKH